MLNEEIVIDIIPLSLCPLLQWQRVTSVVTPEPSNVAHKRGHITPKYQYSTPMFIILNILIYVI